MNSVDLLNRARAYLPEERVALLKDAYAFAESCHNGQKRLSGDPYIVHPLDAAATLAGLQMDATTVAAALLHDVQEDCGVANSELSKRFGRDVARLVEGVTKLQRLTLRAPADSAFGQESQNENLRKMFLAMAEDVRVVVIKLADRLHNMRTLEYLPEEKRLATARETMDIYAPLARRLGIWQISRELEDLAFKYLEPERYREISKLLATKRVSRERYIAQVERIVRDELAKEGIAADVQGRAKHIYSIHRKIERYAALGRSFNEIYDLMAMRVLVETVADCYKALGVIHGLWRPLPGQFDDYIANPKESLYQSLHTTVLATGARPLEIQIRTHEMHHLAEYGVASHWRYKEDGSAAARRKGQRQYEERLSWLRQLLEWQREVSGADEFVESVKADFFQDQVFVYTPKGDVIDLPAGSTPVDFAFRIHTDVGQRCVGGRVNGRLVPLNHKLQNGDLVQIMTSKSSRGPSRDWLNPNLSYLQTSHARQKVRQWFKKEERAENIDRGREMLDKELRRLGLTVAQTQEHLLRIFGFEAWDDLLAALGYGGVSVQLVPLKLAPLFREEEEKEEAPAQAPERTYTAAIRVLGTGDLLTQLGRCCSPVPGDKITGYVTRSRGVTVHRHDCPNVVKGADKARLVDVQWGKATQLYPVAVRIEAWDRVGLMKDIGTIADEEQVNMVGIRTQEHGDHTTTVSITLETTGIEQLTRLFNKLETVRGVISVGRATDGAARR